VTGFVGDTTDDLVEAVGRIGELNRRATRKRCERLFSGRAIVDAYEDLYEARIAALSAQNPQARAE